MGDMLIEQLPYLRIAARRWADDAADLADLVQMTCERALRFAHTFDGRNLRAWLLTILRNLVWSRDRRNTLADDACMTFVLVAEPPRDPTAAKIALWDLQHRVERLPPVQRAVLRLVSVEGKSYEAAGRALGLSAASVRGHLYRARAELRR